MPGDFPVGCGEFVEEDAADGETLGAEYGLDEVANFRGRGEVVDFRGFIEKVADAAAAMLGWGLWNAVEGGLELVDLVGGKDCIADGEALVFDLGWKGGLAGHGFILAFGVQGSSQGSRRAAADRSTAVGMTVVFRVIG